MAAVELVLSLPFFLVVFFVILYYSYAFLIYRTAIDAVSVGGQAVVGRSPLGDSYNPTEVARLAILKVVADNFPYSDNSSECIEPVDGAMPDADGRLELKVLVQYSKCAQLNAFRINFPFVGAQPPALPDIEVAAVVQL